MEGTPHLSNFLDGSVTRNVDSVNASTPNRGCVIRYCPPELFGDDVGNVKNNKTDVYSLSMVIVEVRLFCKNLV